MMKLVQRLDHDGKAKTVATFVLSGGSVKADYPSATYRRHFERDGIMNAAGQRLWPKDGQAFFDALDKEFANSSTVRVVLTKDGRVDEADFDESKHPRESDGKFGEGGGPASTPKEKAAQAFADRAQRHAAVLKKLADQHPNHPQIQAAARVAAEHAKGAKEHPEQAEHHAHGAEHQVNRLREHGEREKNEGHGEAEHGGDASGHWLLNLLKLISGIHHE